MKWNILPHASKKNRYLLPVPSLLITNPYIYRYTVAGIIKKRLLCVRYSQIILFNNDLKIFFIFNIYLFCFFTRTMEYSKMCLFLVLHSPLHRRALRGGKLRPCSCRGRIYFSNRTTYSLNLKGKHLPIAYNCII